MSFYNIWVRLRLDEFAHCSQRCEDFQLVLCSNSGTTDHFRRVLPQSYPSNALSAPLDAQSTIISVPVSSSVTRAVTTTSPAQLSASSLLPWGGSD